MSDEEDDDIEALPWLRPLTLGALGPQVELVRGWLHLAGHAICAREGQRFDMDLHRALLAFQAETGIPTTGTVDDSTWHRLSRIEVGRASNLFRRLRGTTAPDGSLPEMVVRVAVGALGVREGTDIHQRMLPDHVVGQPWAMSFVSWAQGAGMVLYGLSGYGPLRTRQTSTVAAAVAAQRSNALLVEPKPGSLWVHPDGRAGVVLGVADGVMTYVTGGTDHTVQCGSVDVTDRSGMSFIDVCAGLR